jgi:competence protein ComEA
MKLFRTIKTITTLLLAANVAIFVQAADRKDKDSSTRPAKTTQRGDAHTDKVDINKADQATLETLPGVGAQTARAIIAARPFASTSDLERVPGIGPEKMKDLRGKIRASAPSKAAANDRRGSGKVDLNTADVETLEALPGVGPVTARSIVAARPFASVNDLERVQGIGPAKMKELKSQVTVSKLPASAGTRAQSDRSVSQRDGTPAGAPTGRTSTTVSTSSTQRVNLNTATKEELEALPEIGPVKAQAIIDARPFSSPQDVMRVKGIKEATYEEIKDKITVR